MYNDFFGLKRDPFSIAPDPSYLFMSSQHREALAHLLYGMNGGGGFVLLTGEIGAGKTTVCRAFLAQIPQQCRVAYILNPKLNVIEMLQTTCEEFGLRIDKPNTLGLKACIDELNAFLLQSHAKDERCVLVIDEAQNLSSEVLEQLRLLTNLETSERKLLQIILIGQPELRDLLKQPNMEQMAQRVIARYHLSALTQPDTEQYIAYRLAVAGYRDSQFFDAKSLKRIYELTRGIPRRINLLCHRVMLGAYASGKKTANLPLVNKAASELFDELSRKRSTTTLQNKHNHSWQTKWFWILLFGVVTACLVTTGLFFWNLYAAHQVAPNKSASQQPIKQNNATALTTLAKPSIPKVVKPADLNELNQWLLFAPKQTNIVWQSLASLWGLNVDSLNPCRTAKQQQVHCFEGTAGLDLIRRLARPCSLILYDRDGQRKFALMTALTQETATLQWGSDSQKQTITVTLIDLAKVWRGDFLTLWRTPPEYRQRLEAGQSGVAVTWLAQRLAQSFKMPPPEGPQTYDRSLQAKVHAFQIRQGLQPDGIAGAITLMHLNHLTGVDEPRLITELPSGQ